MVPITHSAATRVVLRHSKVIAVSLLVLVPLAALVLRSATVASGESPNRSEVIYATTFGSEIGDFPKIDAKRIPPTCFPGPVLFCRDVNPEIVKETYSSGDDLFLYYVPVVARQVLGVQYPFISIAAFHIFATLIALSLLLWLCDTGTMFRLWLAMVVACFYVTLTIPESIFETAYYASILGCLATTGLLLLLLKILRSSRPFDAANRGYLVGALVMAVIVISSISSRSSTAISYLAAVGIFVVLVGGRWLLHRERVASRVALALVAGLLLLTYNAPKLVANAIITNPTYTIGGQHVIWEAIWSGLGMEPNSYGFKWSDADAQLYVQSVKPGVVPFSAEYEDVLRSRVAEIFLKDPDLFLTWQRDQLFEFNHWHNAPALALSVALLVALVVGGLRSPRLGADRLLASSFVAACLAGFVPALLSSTKFPEYSYTAQVGVIASAAFVGVYLLERIIVVVTKRLPPRPESHQRVLLKT